MDPEEDEVEAFRKPPPWPLWVSVGLWGLPGAGGRGRASGSRLRWRWAVSLTASSSGRRSSVLGSSSPRCGTTQPFAGSIRIANGRNASAYSL